MRHFQLTGIRVLSARSAKDMLPREDTNKPIQHGMMEWRDLGIGRPSSLLLKITNNKKEVRTTCPMVSN